MRGTAQILQYGKVKFVNEGDIIHASELVSSGDDHRDASFVRVSVIFIILDHDILINIFQLILPVYNAY